jgi:transposase InsO family protein
MLTMQMTPARRARCASIHQEFCCCSCVTDSGKNCRPRRTGIVTGRRPSPLTNADAACASTSFRPRLKGAAFQVVMHHGDPNQQAYGWKVTPRYIIRDRDAVYGDVFIRRLRAMSIRDRPTAPRSPWQNGYCERAIGSIRRECLDHVVVFGERHLRHLLRSYATYYNEARTHLSVNRDAPSPRTVHAVGRILPTPFLGGLHHLYVRV